MSLSEEASVSEPSHTFSNAAAPHAAGPTYQPPASDLIAYPHASFRDRLAAFFLDVVLVFIATAMLRSLEVTQLASIW